MTKLGGSEDTSNNEFLIPKGLVPKTGMEYVRRLRDVKYYETIFDILARQFELAKLDEAKEGSLIQVIDPAVPPERRSFPKRTLIVAGATFLGFFFGVCAALFEAAVRHLENDPDGNAKLVLLKRTILERDSSATARGL